MFYKVEPVPAGFRPKRGRLNMIRSLALGESFLVPFTEEKGLRSSATYFNGGQFERRVTVAKEDCGVRCVRVK
jgi:hypothetical protein